MFSSWELPKLTVGEAYCPFCTQEQMDEEKREMNRRAYRIAYLEKVNIPKLYLDARMDDEPRSAGQSRYVEKIRRFMTDDSKLSFVVIGNAGTGKTYYACAMVNELNESINMFEEIRPAAYYATQSEIYNDFKSTYDGDGNEALVMQRYMGYKVLVIDELAGAGWSDNAKSIMTQLITKRADNGLKTFVICNRSDSGFKELFNDPVVSRLLGANCSISCNMTGKDWRNEKYDRETVINMSK
jgi:DNA replication protein DnaC